MRKKDVIARALVEPLHKKPRANAVSKNEEDEEVACLGCKGRDVK